MKWMFRLFVLVLLLAGWGLAALSLHVVLAPGTPGRLAIIPKDRLGFTDTWADVRGWTIEELPNHPSLITRLIQTGKTDLLSHVAGDKETSSKLEQAIKHQAPSKDRPAGMGE
jgi:hypothetical protein